MLRLCLVSSMVAVTVFGLTACKPSEHTTSADAAVSIAVIPKGATHDYWKSLHAGANDAAKQFGCTIIWTAPDLETDRERQIQIVEDFIVQKVDGIVLAPVDRQALVPIVDRVATAKIPCVIVDSAIGTENYLSYIATDNYKGGAMAARRMGKILGGAGKVVVIKYAPGSASTTERENGFLETIKKEFPGIEIVDAKYGMATVESALQATEDLLTRHPVLTGLFACNSSTSIGALRALQSQHRSEVKMVGFDAENALIDALKSGQIDALIVQDPYKMGFEGVKAIVDARKGQPVAKRIDTGVTTVTKDVLDDPKVKQLLKTQ